LLGSLNHRLGSMSGIRVKRTRACRWNRWLSSKISRTACTFTIKYHEDTTTLRCSWYLYYIKSALKNSFLSQLLFTLIRKWANRCIVFQWCICFITKEKLEIIIEEPDKNKIINEECRMCSNVVWVPKWIIFCELRIYLIL